MAEGSMDSMKGIPASSRIHALLAVMVLLGCAMARPKPGPGTVEMTIRSGGAERAFLVHVPGGSSRPAEGLPVVLVFHGRYGTAAGVENQTGFSVIADRERFIAVYPQGAGRRWADGRWGEDMKDVEFISAVLDTLESLYGIDRGRIFAAGMSNGAFFCNYLAENRSELIRAIAPVAGGLACPWPGQFDPPHPVSVLMINGTDDPLVPYVGGEVGYETSRRDQGGAYSAGQSLEMWATANECAGPLDSLEMPDVDPSDGCTCTRFSWQPGEGGARVELIRVEGGGHTWPGLDDTLGERLVGLTCWDFVSPEVIWDFFAASPADPAPDLEREPGTARPPHY
jgi:polyhydroxybutyrate depolymerase